MKNKTLTHKQLDELFWEENDQYWEYVARNLNKKSSKLAIEKLMEGMLDECSKDTFIQSLIDYVKELEKIAK